MLRKQSYTLLLALAGFIFSHTVFAQIPEGFVCGKPIPYGHSHNDYTRKRPLWDALENGFTSIEVDVFLASDGSLRVSHIPFALKLKPTLDELYLKPIKFWIDNNGGKVFSDTDLVFTLMIDVKSNAAKTYPVIKESVRPYLNYLCTWKNGKFNPGPLRIMFSGSRPEREVEQETEQWFCFDGFIGADYTGRNIVVARKSSAFGSFFKKNPSGKLSNEEFEQMKKLAAGVSAEGKEIRFWASGNNKHRWKSMINAGVTVINVDKLEKFRVFLQTGQ